MTLNRPLVPLIAASALAASLLSGCASFAVSDDAIIQRTGFALGLEPGQFTIANRMDEGTTTRYQVKTTTGRQYNCFVGGSVNVLGKSVSDAICTETGAGAPQNTQPKKANCNALQKAAGQC
jgi:hypothetical protein